MYFPNRNILEWGAMTLPCFKWHQNSLRIFCLSSICQLQTKFPQVLIHSNLNQMRPYVTNIFFEFPERTQCLFAGWGYETKEDDCIGLIPFQLREMYTKVNTNCKTGDDVLYKKICTASNQQCMTPVIRYSNHRDSNLFLL